MNIDAALILKACALLLISSAFIRGGLIRRSALRTGPRAAKFVQKWMVMQTLGGICAAAAVWIGAPMVLSHETAMGARWIAAAGLVSTGIDLAVKWRWGAAAGRKGRWAMANAVATLAAGLLFLIIVFYTRSAPVGTAALEVAAPGRGNWRVVSGGKLRLLNHHHGQPASQNYSVDLVLASPAMSASQGQTVYAPTAGEIVAVESDRVGGDGPAEGNMIVIRTEDGTEIHLAHLAENSVRVTTGATVKPGDILADVGATGSADYPHLHIHAEKNGTAVPLLFGSKRDWLVRGDVVYF